jgi:predicted nucleotidyltransferase component of viral defense system
MKITLFNRLKKQQHKDIAILQDELVEIVYSIFPDIVFHGGTSIWRCFKGNRFSEDIDLYYYETKDFENKLKQAILSNNLNLLKFKKTENVIFAKISNTKVEVRLEIRLLDKSNPIFKNKTINQYEKIDGSSITIFSLSSEDLIIEKAQAYKNRKLIRDIYDVYFLMNKVNLSIIQEKKLKEIIELWQKPEDEKNLKTIVYAGAVPSFDQLLLQIKRGF